MHHQTKEIDWHEVERWSGQEGKPEKFVEFKADFLLSTNECPCLRFKFMKKIDWLRMSVHVIGFVALAIAIYGKLSVGTDEEFILNVILFFGALHFLLAFIWTMKSGMFVFRASIVKRSEAKEVYYFLSSLIFLMFCFFSLYLGSRVFY